MFLSKRVQPQKGCTLFLYLYMYLFKTFAKAMKKTICKILLVAMLLTSCTAFVLSFHESTELLCDYLDVAFKFLLCAYLLFPLFTKGK